MCQKSQAKAIKKSLVVYLLTSKKKKEKRANPHKARGIFPKARNRPFGFSNLNFMIKAGDHWVIVVSYLEK